MSKFLCIVDVPVASIPAHDVVVVGVLSVDVFSVDAVLVPVGSAVLESDKGGDSCKIGIFRTPRQWVHEAASKIFPADSLTGCRPTQR
eukprot:6486752-Amphidinium_carterae.2